MYFDLEQGFVWFGNRWKGIRGTVPVGAFKPNVLGFYDLGGNAAEWMQDVSVKGKNEREQRGGYWSFGEEWAQCAKPFKCGSSTTGDSYGFRLARGRP